MVAPFRRLFLQARTVDAVAWVFIPTPTEASKPLAKHATPCVRDNPHGDSAIPNGNEERAGPRRGHKSAGLQHLKQKSSKYPVYLNGLTRARVLP